MTFLEFEGVRKRYGDHEVLAGIDLSIRRHQVVTLIGASGSGKSTLLRCVNALEGIDEGQIRLDGDVVSGPGVDFDRLRRRVGMVFQSFNLFPHMTVRENITLAPRKVLGLSRAEAEARADELLARVGLAERAGYHPDQLSGGQQQRAAIVRSLAMDPEVVLLDEITSALDPELVAEVLSIVRELARDGMTMMLATHEMGFAREVSDLVVFLEKGVILEQGPPAQVLDDPVEARTREFLRAVAA
ncbi:amino acid ABC transporter ATP-binding protein [Protaetiibacter intestinalis]|uniref:ABC-type polar-amino-acid transporter n=1 Tax=Protaetiibacter intestinalis TaxID=2419774 RepID=A0A387B9S8_9MICO|nr:amino acid ABC transporter ATP-binding protein [Protaetiibacter intestinalis]AYF97866.1 amino acid ABC transporter ATP-binding protein [Protaetiibacter intestinalis]